MTHKRQSIIKKHTRYAGKTLAVITLIFLAAVIATSYSPVYDFRTPTPFSGPDIFNPYADLDTANRWKRANFHTHTRVKGPIPPNECKYWPDETDAAYRKLGYDIVTFSNHNELTRHPYDSTLQVNVYEHGYNIFKYHKLVFGAEKVNPFDHLLPLIASQKQFQLDLLGKDADFIQMNHPARTIGTCKSHFQQLEGFQIMELDAGKTTENEYWDWSLSAGHYTFGLANDDLHYPDRTKKIARRCNFLAVPGGRYEDLKDVLLTGGYYSMRIPDYGNGDWEVKYEANRHLPTVTDIGLKDGNTIFIDLDRQADSIKVTGQDHTTLAIATDTDSLRYAMKPTDPYARITAYFPAGEVIYSNPFARYDASKATSPYVEPSHTVNVPLTILFNLLVTLLLIGDIYLIWRLVRRRRSSVK
ncbi:MAG: hypothetical protein K2J78_06530 [Muribaculaceae bacterium]|nr:hypothetical protein [Muribaculaceae bacterium]